MRPRRVTVAVVFALGLAACGHVRPADPAAAPAPWPAETAPPPARAPAPIASPALASPPPPAPPSPTAPHDRELPGEGPPHPIVLPRPDRAKLACGADLLVVRRSRLPLATIYVVWPTGAAAEPAARAGIASLTADLLTEGAGARSALEVAAEVERLGARLASGATWDATFVTLTTLGRTLDPALAVLGDVVLRPRFEASEVERVRKSSKSALLQLTDQAAQQAALAGARAIYADDDRYRELLQGSARGLDVADRDGVVGWHAAFLRPEQATVIVVGDVELAAIRRRLDRALGPARRPAAPPAAPPPAPGARRPSTAVPRVLFVDKPGAAQTEVRVVEPGPPRLTPDYFPLTVLNTIFGGNFSSRLNANLREKHGFTYGARSDFAFRRDGGPFTATAPVKAAVTRAALVELEAELARLATGEVTDDELRLAKQTLQRSLARAFETPPEVAGALALLRTYRLPDDFYATYAARVEAVTPADLRRVARALRPDMTVVLVGDEKTLGADVRSLLGPYEKVELGR